jgi:hypothetical protein
MPTVDVVGWSGPWAGDDPHARFKERVAESARLEPLATLENLSAAVGVPVGGLVHHVLVEWASAGSRGLLEIGPRELDRLLEIVDGDEPATEIVEALRGRLAWLRAGLQQS